MNKRKFLTFIAIPIISCFLQSCGDDDNAALQAPLVNLISGDTAVKPDSTNTLVLSIDAPNSFEEDDISLAVTGSGQAEIVEVQGAGTTFGQLSVAFTAGSTANESAILTITVTDLDGLIGQVGLSITITDLDIPVAYVINEGNFAQANGSISSVDIRSGEVVQGVYEAEATVQNVRVFGGTLYLVGNAPDKVDVINGFSTSASISSGLDNPIDIAVLGSTGYVTNWGDISTAFGDSPDSYVAVLNLSTEEVTDSIMLSARPQDIISTTAGLYVSHEAASFISFIDVVDNSVSTIETPFGPSEMELDASGDILALCTGGSLIKVDSENRVVTLLDGLSTSGFNEKMALDTDLNVVYYLGTGNSSFTGQTTVFSIDLSQDTPEETTFLEGGVALYGISVNPESGQIYVGDNNSFQSTGTAFIYSTTGEEIASFATGVGPNGFLFF